MHQQTTPPTQLQTTTPPYPQNKIMRHQQQQQRQEEEAAAKATEDSRFVFDAGKPPPFRIGDVRALDAYRSVDFHLVDGPGGGETIDPALLRNRRSDIPLILAGGLTPENVAAMIDAVHPFAVDVASGVEAEPGRKDPERVRAFLAAVDGAAVPGR